MFFQNRRVEEELERIRKANLPSERKDEGETEELEILDAADIGGLETVDVADTEEVIELEASRSKIIDESGKSAVSDDLKLTSKDVLAMIIAAFSIIIPYALLFIGIAILFLYLFIVR